MKSRFFTDTQGLDAAPVSGDRVSVCLMLNRRTYESAVREAERLHMTSGEYIEWLIAQSLKTRPM